MVVRSSAVAWALPVAVTEAGAGAGVLAAGPATVGATGDGACAAETGADSLSAVVPGLGVGLGCCGCFGCVWLLVAGMVFVVGATGVGLGAGSETADGVAMTAFDPSVEIRSCKAAC